MTSSLCSTPLAAAATKPVFQAAILALAAALLYLGIPAFDAAWNVGSFSAVAVRLQPLEACGTGLSISAINLTAFGLLFNGCPIRAKPAAISSDGTWIVQFPANFLFNGYFFDASSNPESAPCRWIIDADTDGRGVEWNPVSASVWRTAHGGSGQGLQLYPGLRAAAPAGHGARVLVDHSVAVLPEALSALVDIDLAACMLCIVATANLEREDAVRSIILAFVAGAGILTAAEAIAWASVDDHRATWEMVLRIVALSTLELALGLWEHKLVPGLFAAAIMYTAAVAGSDALYGNSGGVSLMLALGQEYCSAAFLFAFVTLCVRWAVLVRAQRLVFADKEQYDALWAIVSSGAEAKEQLAELCEQVMFWVWQVYHSHLNL